MFYGLHISLESRGEDSGPVEQRHVSQEASRGKKGLRGDDNLQRNPDQSLGTLGT